MPKTAVLGLCLLLPSCDTERNSPSEQAIPSPYDTLVSVTLWDVQGLFGGQNLFLARDGTTYVQIVRPPKVLYPQGGLHEQRFRLSLNQAEVDAFLTLLKKNDFLGIQIPERFGIPDEARPTLQVRFSSGESRTVAKWGNDTHERFDALYTHLLDLAKKAAGMKPIYDGRWEEKWFPEGFGIPK